MNEKEVRQKYLNNIYTKKILKMFSEPISKEDSDIITNNISCAEAAQVLQHTMEVIETSVPLNFNVS